MNTIRKEFEMTLRLRFPHLEIEIDRSIDIFYYFPNEFIDRKAKDFMRYAVKKHGALDCYLDWMGISESLVMDWTLLKEDSK